MQLDEVKLASKLVEPPQPVEPNKPMQPKTPRFTFTCYRTPCAVSLTAAHRFRRSGVDENSVADTWLQLSSDKYSSVIADCLEWRDKLRLPDWGYVCFVEKMTTSFFTPTQIN